MVTIFFSRVSSWSRGQTQASHTAGGFFTTKSPEKPLLKLRVSLIALCHCHDWMTARESYILFSVIKTDTVLLFATLFLEMMGERGSTPCECESVGLGVRPQRLRSQLCHRLEVYTWTLQTHLCKSQFSTYKIRYPTFSSVVRINHPSKLFAELLGHMHVHAHIHTHHSGSVTCLDDY